ncbi:MAG: nucleotide exchange factor GrpE [Saccharofermentanales bacterium]
MDKKKNKRISSDQEQPLLEEIEKQKTDVCEETPEQADATAETKTDAGENEQEQYRELEDKYLRLAAEYDNFRRRSRKEKEALYSDSISDVVSKFLPILDNVDRALELAEDCTNPETLAFAEGVQLIRKQLEDIFAGLDIHEIKALGETFDPNLHHAVSHIEDETKDVQVITEVFMTGYIRNDRVLRHSVVQVAN